MVLSSIDAAAGDIGDGASSEMIAAVTFVETASIDVVANCIAVACSDSSRFILPVMMGTSLAAADTRVVGGAVVAAAVRLTFSIAAFRIFSTAAGRHSSPSLKAVPGVLVDSWKKSTGV